jgi:hypothetical protein
MNMQQIEIELIEIDQIGIHPTDHKIEIQTIKIIDSNFI